MTLLPAPGTDDYRQALRTDDERWAERKRIYYRTHRRQCAICESRDNIDLHHRHYHDPRGWENDGTLVPLCKPCHRAVHRYHDRKHPGDVHPYRHLDWATTAFIWRTRLRLKVNRFRLSAWMTALNILAGAWAAVTVGFWLPVLVAAATIIAGPVRRKIAR